MSDSRAVVLYQPPPAPVPYELVDSRGRPLRDAHEVLTGEIAGPTVTGLRSILSGHPAQDLDPVKLTHILRSAELGDADAYLELAEELEEKDLHYQAELGKRKRAVSQLPIEVDPASESPDHEGDAQFVRDWLKRQTLQSELGDMLDSLGKGFSATEILWDVKATAWLPRQLKRRDPRFFEFDRITGEQLLLRGGISGEAAMPEPLPPEKFIVHITSAKAGLPIRGGLARGVAWLYLFKNFSIKDWVTFLEVYGIPLRIGKYPNGTSEADIRKLARAVSKVGTDAGCVIPATMQMELITSQGSAGNPEMFERLCAYVDALISKAVLGQTLSSTAESTGMGSGVADLQGEVRDDIRDDDAVQLSATLTQQLVPLLVGFNRGSRDQYPMIRIGRPDAVDVKQAIESMQAGVALGVPIAVSTFRKLTGLPEPKDGEALLSAPAPQTPQIEPQAPGGPVPPKKGGNGLLDPLKTPTGAIPNGGADSVAAGAGDPVREPDATDRLVEASIGALAGIDDQLIGNFEQLIDGATSLEEVRELVAIGAGDVLAGMDLEDFTQMLERAGFAAKIAGLVAAPGQ